MSSSNVKLVYFNGRGRAEQLRWILVQGEAKWEDKRIEFADWPGFKSSTPIGSLPFIDADGTKVPTSGAIALHLAREFDLLGCNSLEGSLIHMIWECTQDAFNVITKAGFCEDKEQQALLFKTYYEETLPKLIKLMACRLEKNKSCWLVGDKMSMADLVTTCLLEQHKEGPGCEAIKAGAGVQELVNRVTDLPNIKKWIASRPVTDF